MAGGRFCLTCWIFFLACYQVVSAAELIVHLESSPSTGTVVFSLFNSANTFGDLRDPMMVVKQKLGEREDYLIKKVPPGEYALMVFYDENENNRIDRNFIGIPIEPIGFSNGYQPKGPPSYNRATFVLTEGEKQSFKIELYRPLGSLGRIGVGLGVIARSSPYRDYNESVYRAIPAITYNSERLQILGPKIQFGLIGTGKIRFAIKGTYRIGVYEEDASVFLQGMGDRKSTFMAGLALQVELPEGVDFSVSYEHDVLNEIGGGTARLELDRSFQFGLFRLSPQVGLNWNSSQISNNDFGVPQSNATPERPFYELDDTISIEIGLGIFVDVSSNWMMVINVAAEFFDEEITDSPIVCEDLVVKGFGAITYVF